MEKNNYKRLEEDKTKEYDNCYTCANRKQSNDYNLEHSFNKIPKRGPISGVSDTPRSVINNKQDVTCVAIDPKQNGESKLNTNQVQRIVVDHIRQDHQNDLCLKLFCKYFFLTCCIITIICIFIIVALLFMNNLRITINIGSNSLEHRFINLNNFTRIRF